MVEVNKVACRLRGIIGVYTATRVVVIVMMHDELNMFAEVIDE